MRHAARARSPFLRTWLIWVAGFVAFPVAGLAGTAAAGRADSLLAALLGGTVSGAVLGAGQALASRRRLDWRTWVPATAAGMGVGLMIGATSVDYRTAIADLIAMGAVTGAVLGATQTLALPSATRHRWLWAAAMPVLWASGWTVTTLIGYEVDEQVMIFGASGALVFTALSGVLLQRLVPSHNVSAGTEHADAPVEVRA